MTTRKNYILKEAGKKSIVYDVNYISSNQLKPVVIFSHGYKGFKDWGAWHLVADEFAKAGFVFIKFNFSHNGGTVSQPIDFPDLEAFANNNFSIELDDLDRVLNYLFEANEFSSEIDLNRINLLAHSRGGGIALIKAAEDDRISKVGSWAGVSDFKTRFHEDSEAFKQWKKTGVTYVENGRTKQQMPHYIQFYDNFKANENRLTIKSAVQELKFPQLIIHGSADPTVTVDEATKMHQWNPNSRLEIINDADHVFGSKHPWEKAELPTDLLKAVEITIDFFK